MAADFDPTRNQADSCGTPCRIQSMRTHGTLTKWNDERGFGFILPVQGTKEVFVHISAFPRDGTRPHVGELVSFDLEAGEDGGKRAMHVSRPGSRQRPPRREPTTRHRHPSRLGSRVREAIVVVMLVGVVAAFGYTRWHSKPSGPAMPIEHDESTLIGPEPTFSCDGRTMCSQMRSCAEATYFLKHCPGTKMDGNHDGVPCEQQWCSGSQSFR